MFVLLAVVLGIVSLRLLYDSVANIGNDGNEHAVVAKTSSEDKTENKQNTKQEIVDYTLDFSAEYLVGERSFLVKGSTNLPDSSILQITIHDKDYYDYDSYDPAWRYENLTYITESAEIREGVFSKKITGTAFEAPLNSEEYSVTLTFNPKYLKQPKAVKAQVGENGEYLGGDYLDKSLKGLTLLEKEEVIDLEGNANLRQWDNPQAKQICLEHPSWTKDDCIRVASGQYWIGMHIDMLKYNLGSPDSANPSNYGYGVEWQWCWYDSTPSCFYDDNNDGFIDSYN